MRRCRAREFLLVTVVPFILTSSVAAQIAERRISWADLEAKASSPP